MQTKDLTRREVARRTGVLASGGLMASLAGCSEAANSIAAADLEITDLESSSTAFGNVIVRVMVTNKGESSAEATLKAQVDVEGGDTYTKSRGITVPGGDSNSYKFEFDIDFSSSGSRYQYSATLE